MGEWNAAPSELVKGNAPIGDEIVPYPGNPMGIPVIAVKRAAIIEGGQLVDARQSYEPQTNAPIVDITFNSEGGRRFARVTRENTGKQFAMILDNQVISAPSTNEPIMGGKAMISGSFTVESANELAIALRSGTLPVPLKTGKESGRE